MSATSGTRRASALNQIVASTACRRCTRVVEPRLDAKALRCGRRTLDRSPRAPHGDHGLMLRPASLIGISTVVAAGANGSARMYHRAVSVSRACAAQRQRQRGGARAAAAALSPDAHAARLRDRRQTRDRPIAGLRAVTRRCSSGVSCAVGERAETIVRFEESRDPRRGVQPWPRRPRPARPPSRPASDGSGATTDSMMVPAGEVERPAQPLHRRRSPFRQPRMAAGRAAAARPPRRLRAPPRSRRSTPARR